MVCTGTLSVILRTLRHVPVVVDLSLETSCSHVRPIELSRAV